MKARATCNAQNFFESKLELDADGQPHPRHANAIGWPPTKDAQKLLQKKLAAVMTLEIRPP
jgi:hypothetical protein